MLYWTLADMVASRGARTAVEREFLGLPLYDITAVCDGIPDFRPHLKAKVPKRLPHEALWVEYEEDVFAGERWTSRVVGRNIQGNWFTNLGDDYVDTLRPSLASRTFDGDDEGAHEWARHAIGFTAFSMQLHTSHAEGRALNGLAFCVLPNVVFLFSDDWTRVMGLATNATGVMRRVDGPVGGMSLGLPVMDTGGDPEWVPWGAVLVFGLLACRNVGAVSQPPPPRRNEERARRHGLPARRPHRILRLLLPADARERAPSAAGEETGRHMPLHCVRGHFMHLADERYTEKRGQWVWRSPHVRGNANFGVVDKTYVPEPR